MFESRRAHQNLLFFFKDLAALALRCGGFFMLHGAARSIPCISVIFRALSAGPCNMDATWGGVISITAEWIAALSGVGALGVAVGAVIRGRIEDARRSMPIIRCQWFEGTAGQSARLEIVNRLNEDLLVSKIECKTRFVLSTRKPGAVPDEPGEFIYEFVDSPRKLDFAIESQKSKKLSVAFDGLDTERWLRLTVSSSANTLSRKRFVVRDNQRQ